MTNQTIDIAAVLAKLAAMEASNAALEQRAMQAETQAAAAKQAAQRKLSLKVSVKGAVSLYGMGQFPVTLYAGQWERVLAASDEIIAFIAANKSHLAVKGDKATV